MTDTEGQDEIIMRELIIEKPYLHLPVKNGAPQRVMRFVVEGREVREFAIELADAEPDFWVFADVSAFRGKALQIHVEELLDASQGVASIRQADDVPGAAGTTTPTAWCTATGDIISSTSTTPMVGAGETCTGGTQ
jgi:hypothetical protein